MDDYYNEESADETKQQDEASLEQEVFQNDDELMLTDAFLKEVFRKR